MTAEFLMDWVCTNSEKIRSYAGFGTNIEDWLRLELAQDITRRGWTAAAEIPFPREKGQRGRPKAVDLIYLFAGGLYCMVEIKVQHPEDEYVFGGGKIGGECNKDINKLIDYAAATGAFVYNNYYLMVVTTHAGSAEEVRDRMRESFVHSECRNASHNIGVAIAHAFHRPGGLPN